MPDINLSGFDDLLQAFENISKLDTDTKIEALDAMAEIAAAKIKETGQNMGVRDENSSTHILDAIKVKKPKLTKDGGHADVTFAGSRRRGNTSTRAAEIAFVNEYGKKSQTARPFIRTAMAENEEKILKAGADIIGAWMEKTFKK